MTALIRGPSAAARSPAEEPTGRTTLAPRASFDVERRTANRAGDDRIVARSRHLASGQVCRGVITFG